MVVGHKANTSRIEAKEVGGARRQQAIAADYGNHGEMAELNSEGRLVLVMVTLSVT